MALSQGPGMYDEGIKPKTPQVDSSTVRDYMAQTRDQLCSQLSAMYDEAQRDKEFLDQALDLAQSRCRILSAAMEVLNAPQQATAPSFRQ